MQNQNQSRLGRTRFPALSAGHVYLLWALIGSLCCLRLLRLAIVIALVLVLQHSNGNRSISLLYHRLVNQTPWLLKGWITQSGQVLTKPAIRHPFNDGWRYQRSWSFTRFLLKRFTDPRKPSELSLVQFPWCFWSGIGIRKRQSTSSCKIANL